MADYVEPTQTEFDNASEVLSDVLSTAYPSMQTKTGSVIRELIVRPLAFLYSWCTSNADNYRTKSSIAYLKTSQATENEIADAVASNYFVTRKEGTKAAGIVTLNISSVPFYLQAGFQFTAGGVAVETASRIVALGTTSTEEEQNDTLYIKAVAVDDHYVVNIPVTAVDTGAIEVLVGAEVTTNSANNQIISMALGSPITGGSSIETDAEMMVRAEFNTAESGVGSYYGIRKKLNDAPVPVTGLKVLAGEDAPVFRARYNSANINPGCFVDCYVKTQTQASIAAINATAVYDVVSGKFKATVRSDECAGFYGITAVYAGGSLINNYSVEFGTSDSSWSASGSRLGAHQTATVAFTAVGSGELDIVVYVKYMPGLQLLQNYIEEDSNKFVGQSIEIKAAVPVVVHVDCEVESEEQLTDDELALLKSTIANTINAVPVGTSAINFSDLRKACSTALPSATLRLPCVISGDLTLKDGSSDAYYSNTGIFDVEHMDTVEGHWDHAMCFFSAVVDNIRIVQK